MEFMDDIIFVGLDIPKAVKKMLDQADETICKNMTPDEKKVYDYGVKTTLDALKGLVSDWEDYEVCVHIPGKDVGEEFVYEDLKKIIL
jgi:hypothetical protein